MKLKSIASLKQLESRMTICALRIKNSIRRLEILLENIDLKDSDETSYNEIEFILQELRDIDL